jgi:Flp pilus assembly protein TadG
LADVITTLRSKRRRAVAAVELAIVTPVLLTMLFGIVEFGWIFTVRQALVTASREGARTASLPGATEEDVQARISEYTTPLGLGDATTQVAADENGPTGTVTVSIPYASVTLVGSYFGSTTGTLTATCSMKKETVN